MSEPIYQCSQLCSRYNEEKHGTCEAFPVGIPDEIRGNDFDHTKPYFGDNGIRFSPSPKFGSVKIAKKTQYSIFHKPPPKAGERGLMELD